MLRGAARAVAGPIVSHIIVRAANADGLLPHPIGDARVHAMGPDPDRILMVGSDIVSGIGVTSYELGIGGHLARRLSALTGRGAEIQLAGTPDLTVPGARRVLEGAAPGRFDAVVLMLGTREAVGLRSATIWRRDLTGLFDDLAQIGRALPVFVVSIATLPSDMPFSPVLRPVVGRQIDRLNAIARELCETFGAHFVPCDDVTLDDFGSLGDTSTYFAWAEPIAVHLRPVLDAAVPVRRAAGGDEELRQAALDAMGVLESPPTAALDAIAQTAKDLFGVLAAAVNLVDHDRVAMISASGIERTDAPRSESFCSTTVELGGVLVLEDTRLDPRFSDLEAVGQGILFYAGYPIEAPNGQRVGTLCLFDTRPRTFSTADESLLRELALRAQAQLWAVPRVPAA